MHVNDKGCLQIVGVLIAMVIVVAVAIPLIHMLWQWAGLAK